MRSLAPEEAELWSRVTATIRPLSRDPLPEKVPAPSAASPPSKSISPPKPRQVPKPPIPRRVTLGTTLDGTWDRKLRGGAVEPDRVLDLHGLNLDSAWSAIDSGLDRSIRAGDRVLLLITGHSRPGEPPVQRGRIRAAVHDWLAVSHHASRIAAVRGAHKRHGGGGSLYIILRRG